jgi:hypothetical protein
MKQLPDRQKARRRYLKSKFFAYLSVTAVSIIFLPAMIVAVLMWLGVIAIIVWGMWILASPRDPFASDFGPLWAIPAMALFLAILAIVPSLIAWWAFVDIKHSRQDASSIPYVPPVTSDTLPADEILVRGSEQPLVAQSEILLRASKEQGQETPVEELLRVS